MIANQQANNKAHAMEVHSQNAQNDSLMAALLLHLLHKFSCCCRPYRAIRCFCGLLSA
jgi:hypothetical protein